MPLATVRALLEAMGVAVGSAREVADSLREAEARPWRRMLAPVRVIASPARSTYVHAAGAAGGADDRLDACPKRAARRHEGRLTPDTLTAVAAAEVDGEVWRRWQMPLPPICRTATTSCR